MNESESPTPSSDPHKLIRGQVQHRQISARVPEQVARGVFATGVIVLMGNTEFILDFVLRMQRPHQVVQRIILPHAVLGQMIDVLEQNLDKYQQRFGTRPEIPMPVESVNQAAKSSLQEQDSQAQAPVGDSDTPEPAPGSSGAGKGAGGHVSDGVGVGGVSGGGGVSGDGETSGGEGEAQESPTIQDIYDDLRLPDEGLLGAYANAVMISHSGSEFNFDFILNFFPRSVVTARVFISAPQVINLLNAVKNTYREFQQRLLASQREQQARLRQQMREDQQSLNADQPYYQPPPSPGSSPGSSPGTPPGNSPGNSPEAPPDSSP